MPTNTVHEIVLLAQAAVSYPLMHAPTDHPKQRHLPAHQALEHLQETTHTAWK